MKVSGAENYFGLVYIGDTAAFKTLTEEQCPDVLRDKELFLLRNLSRGKGIGFFEDSGFYPDFILWVTEGSKQRLVFIEPHGMLNEDHPDKNAKIDLHKKLQTQLADARKKSKNKDLLLDSFIISATPFDDLQKRHGVTEVGIGAALECGI